MKLLHRISGINVACCMLSIFIIQLNLHSADLVLPVAHDDIQFHVSSRLSITPTVGGLSSMLILILLATGTSPDFLDSLAGGIERFWGYNIAARESALQLSHKWDENTCVVSIDLLEMRNKGLISTVPKDTISARYVPHNNTIELFWSDSHKASSLFFQRRYEVSVIPGNKSCQMSDDTTILVQDNGFTVDFIEMNFEKVNDNDYKSVDFMKESVITTILEQSGFLSQEIVNIMAVDVASPQYIWDENICNFHIDVDPSARIEVQANAKSLQPTIRIVEAESKKVLTQPSVPDNCTFKGVEDILVAEHFLDNGKKKLVGFTEIDEYKQSYPFKVIKPRPVKKKEAEAPGITDMAKQFMGRS